LRLLLLALLFGIANTASAQAWAWDDGTVPFVVTPNEIVERMLRMADVKAGDTLIDLGSGDGRIVIGAAQRGAIFEAGRVVLEGTSAELEANEDVREVYLGVGAADALPKGWRLYRKRRRW